MKTEKYSKVNWFDHELLTKQGEILLYKINDYYITRQWFEGENKLFFKPHFPDKISSPLGETIYYYLAKRIALDALQVRPAYLALSNIVENNGYEGSVSKNFIGKNQKLILASELGFETTVRGIIGELKNYCSKLKKQEKLPVLCDFETITEDLKKVALLDFLVVNEDRYPRNIGFLITNDKDKIKVELAPIFDNAMIFFLNETSNFAHLKDSFKDKTTYFIHDKIDCHNPILTLKKSSWSLYIWENQSLLLKQFAKEIQTNDDFAKCFKTLKKISFDNLLKEIQKDIPNYPLNPDDFAVIKNIFELQTARVEEKFNSLKKANQIEK